MRVLSVNVGRAQALPGPGEPRTSAIRKVATGGPCALTAAGFAGDECVAKMHGGPYQAVLLFSAATYPEFEKRYGRPLPFGTFGENLTVEGLSDGDACIGDVITVGAARLEVTKPRGPCGTLAKHLGDPGIVEAISKPHRAGWYARVLAPAEIRAGDSVALVERPNPVWTIVRAAAVKQDERDLAGAAALAAVPGLAPDLRDRLARRAEGFRS